MPRRVLSIGGTMLAVVLAFVLGYILANRPEPLSERRTGPVRESNTHKEGFAFNQTRTRDESIVGDVTKLTAEEVRVGVAEALRIPGRLASTARLAEALAQVSAENWRGILAAFAQEARRSELSITPEFRLALERVGEVAGVAALEEMLASTYPRKEELLQALMLGWATSDPAAAWKWAPNAHPVSLADEALAGMARTDPKQALTLASRFAHLKSLPRIIDAAVSLGGLAGAEQLLSTLTSEPGVRDFTKSKVFEELAWREFASAEDRGDPFTALDWLDPYLGQDWERSDIVHGFTSTLAKIDGQRTLEWLSARTDRFTQKQAIAFKAAASGWQEQAGAEVRTWIAAHPEHPYQTDIVYAAANFLLSSGRSDEVEQWKASARSAETLAGLEQAIRNQAMLSAEQAEKGRGSGSQDAAR